MHSDFIESFMPFIPINQAHSAGNIYISPPMNRRHFLQKTSATLGTASIFANTFALHDDAQFPTSSADVPWFNRSMRWAQLAFVENDPATYDADFWLDYFKRVHADGVLLSAGGVVAFYPTEIPLHHRSAWLENSDPLGYLVNACRKMNMSIILRTD